MDTNTNSKASVEFDLTRPLGLSRSGNLSTHLSNTPIVYVYSKALDGFNSITVAKVEIANIVGLHPEQVHALTDRIADEFVAPGFSEEEVKDIAYVLKDAVRNPRVHDGCDFETMARKLCDDITARRRLNLSGAR